MVFNVLRNVSCRTPPTFITTRLDRFLLLPEEGIASSVRLPSVKKQKRNIKQRWCVSTETNAFTISLFFGPCYSTDAISESIKFSTITCLTIVLFFLLILARRTILLTFSRHHYIERDLLLIASNTFKKIKLLQLNDFFTGKFLKVLVKYTETEAVTLHS